jgi:hypothetical protein
MHAKPTALAALAALLLAAVLGPARPAAAETLRTRVPFAFTVPSCSGGEPITIEGTLHIVQRVVRQEGADAAGGTHEGFSYTVHGQGTDANGVKYVLSEGSSYARNAGANGGEAATNTIRTVLIRQGESHPGDGQTHVTLHLTENANGQVTANFENGRGVCL